MSKLVLTTVPVVVMVEMSRLRRWPLMYWNCHVLAFVGVSVWYVANGYS